MARKKNLASLSAPELESQIQDLMRQRDELNEQIRPIKSALSAVITKEANERRLATMSDSEKQALVQAIKADRVESKTSFGGEK